MNETQHIEKKSLRVVSGATADWDELAKDCVAFANARGGSIQIGIEDADVLPPPSQRIDAELGVKVQKRISELTINIGVYPETKRAENGGEYLELKVLMSASTIASTTNGRYYIRVSDETKPVLPDELNRLFTDKSAFVWETQVRSTVRVADADPAKLEALVADIKSSERISAFVKSKTDKELLYYYLMAEDDFLTNLGVLWIGQRADRAKLLYGPTVQFIKFDERNVKVNKLVWDDFMLNPKELIEAVWTQIPDWKEGIEVNDGIFRKFVFNYEEEVVRELIANALVHRPYTTRGDIFINLFPDRLEVHNPGLLPLGVTAANILHKTVRRNEHLAKVFYDLKLMEREGTGFDRMYDVLLSNGKRIPEAVEGDDRVTVTIRKQVLKNEVIKLVERVNDEFQLQQKERICLGLISQHGTLSALELSQLLNLKTQQPNAIRDWLGRLPELMIIKSKGKTRGTEYFVNPEILRKLSFKVKTTLSKIEPHRLKELIIQDLREYPNSTLSEIHQRIGSEIKIQKVRKVLTQLLEEKVLLFLGGKKFRTYSLISQSL